MPWKECHVVDDRRRFVLLEHNLSSSTVAHLRASTAAAVRLRWTSRATAGNLRLNHARKLEAPPGFEPGMELLPTRLGRLSC